MRAMSTEYFVASFRARIRARTLTAYRCAGDSSTLSRVPRDLMSDKFHPIPCHRRRDFGSMRESRLFTAAIGFGWRPGSSCSRGRQPPPASRRAARPRRDHHFPAPPPSSRRRREAPVRQGGQSRCEAGEAADGGRRDASHRRRRATRVRRRMHEPYPPTAEDASATAPDAGEPTVRMVATNPRRLHLADKDMAREAWRRNWPTSARLGRLGQSVHLDPGQGVDSKTPWST